MRIDSVSHSELLKHYGVKHRFVTGTVQAGTDKTELTDGARTFSAALKAATEMMETRTPQETAHIQEVARQIESNTYSVPGEKVAEKILGL